MPLPEPAHPAPAATPVEGVDPAIGPLGHPPSDVLARISMATQAIVDQVSALHAYTASSLVGNLFGAAIVLLLFHNVAPRWALLTWGLPFAVVWLLRVALAWRYRRASTATTQALLRWRLDWNLLVVASGSLWGLAAWLFYPIGDDTARTAVLLILFSICVGAVPLLATQYLVFFAYLTVAFVPTIIRVAADAVSPNRPVLVGVQLLILASAAVLCHNYRSAFDRVIRLKMQAQELLLKLQTEKAAAEAARREAEVANRAKTQFFAAASHDLRQPLHALGLFAEALRARSSQDAEVLHLVSSINASVDALESLFSELLDITRIDTGGVEVRPEHFRLGDLFTRLKLHYEPTAFEKGLSLKFRGGQHHAYSDPLLVERILRNLVANAIRYSNDGGVLVSARQRGGQLWLQVWDTGLGIRPREQERIFEEFYQVAHDAPPLEPHQRKGLGLGLAIVRRLSGLLKAPLRLSSVPGRGTVFTFEVPVGSAPRSNAPLPPPRPALGLTLDRRMMVVVEDDEAVKGGLEVLLKSWGAQVVAFGTAAACEEWLAQITRGQQVPDLALVDYRLEAGRTGMQVIEQLRRKFGNTLPVVLVTGSVMTDHELQAHANDFHLLHKPVAPNKLRAMIAFKLGMR